MIEKRRGLKFDMRILIVHKQIVEEFKFLETDREKHLMLTMCRKLLFIKYYNILYVHHR